MKAFIVTVVMPNEWFKQDVLIAINTGIKDHAKLQNKDLSGISHSVTIAEVFDLKRQDL